MPHSELQVVVPSKGRPSQLLRCASSIRVSINLASQLRVILSVVIDGDSYPSAVLSQLSNELGASVCHTKGVGPGLSRNKGAEASDSPFLLFVDDDCVLPECYFQKLSSVLTALDKDTVAVGGAVKPLQRTYHTRIERYLALTKHLDGPLTANNRIVNLSSANLIVRRSAFDKCGGFAPEFTQLGGEDQNLVSRLSMLGDITFVKDLCLYHDHKITFLAFMRKFHAYGRGVALNNKLLPKELHLDTMYQPIIGSLHAPFDIISQFRKRIQEHLSDVPDDMKGVSEYVLALVRELSFQTGYHRTMHHAQK